MALSPRLYAHPAATQPRCNSPATGPQLSDNTTAAETARPQARRAYASAAHRWPTACRPGRRSGPEPHRPGRCSSQSKAGRPTPPPSTSTTRAGVEPGRDPVRRQHDGDGTPGRDGVPTRPEARPWAVAVGSSEGVAALRRRSVTSSPRPVIGGRSRGLRRLGSPSSPAAASIAPRVEPLLNSLRDATDVLGYASD